jgi:hypothetical protein
MVCAGRLESLGVGTMAIEVYVFTIGVPNSTVREVGCIKRDQHKPSSAITRPALLVGHVPLWMEPGIPMSFAKGVSD